MTLAPPGLTYCYHYSQVKWPRQRLFLLAFFVFLGVWIKITSKAQNNWHKEVVQVKIQTKKPS